MDCRRLIMYIFERFSEEHGKPMWLLLIFLGFLYLSDIQLKSSRKADLKSSFQVRILCNLQVLASFLLLCGFLLEFSSKHGRLLIAAASAISTSISGSVAFVKGIDYQSTSLKKEFDGRPEFPAPIIRLFGSLLNLIALLSISNDKMSMVWSGLIGSFFIYIGGLLNT